MQLQIRLGGFQKQSVTALCCWTTQNVFILSFLLDSLSCVLLTGVSRLCSYTIVCLSSYFWLRCSVEPRSFSWKWTRCMMPVRCLTSCLARSPVCWLACIPCRAEHRAACGMLPKHVELQLVETRALSRKYTTRSGNCVTGVMWLRITRWLSCVREDDQLSGTRGNSEMLCRMFKKRIHFLKDDRFFGRETWKESFFYLFFFFNKKYFFRFKKNK